METAQSRQVVVTSATKNMGTSIILAVLFGPLGMLYSTMLGGLVMLVVSAIVALLTLGFGLLVTWPICIIWAAIATSSYNKKLISGEKSY